MWKRSVGTVLKSTFAPSLIGTERGTIGSKIGEHLGNIWGTVRVPSDPSGDFMRYPCRLSCCNSGPGYTHNPKVGGSNPPPATKTLFSIAYSIDRWVFSTPRTRAQLQENQILPQARITTE